MRILVAGGAGYIGSHTALALIEAGHEVLVADNFSNSKPEVLKRLNKLAGRSIPFQWTDFTDPTQTDALFGAHPVDAVMHFAGLKAVGESVQNPLAYYSTNLNITLHLLRAMEVHAVTCLVFSSSATVYAPPGRLPIQEDFPLGPVNPYGHTKRMIETILQDYCTANPAMRVALLRYFNPIGAHASGLIGEDPCGTPNNLLPYISQVAVGLRPRLPVFGNTYETADGTGVRDYIHVVDLARGHIAALSKLQQESGLFTYNLGTGKGTSVLEMIRAFEEASAKPIPYEIMPPRAGDIAACYADPTKALQELKWEAQYDLARMCADSWRWQKNNPHGYADKPNMR